jgi:hypothetical protein
MRKQTFFLGITLGIAGITPAIGQTQITLCTTVEDVLICDNGASVLTVDRDTVIYNPPRPRDPVPVERPPATPWTR